MVDADGKPLGGGAEITAAEKPIRTATGGLVVQALGLGRGGRQAGPGEAEGQGAEADHAQDEAEQRRTDTEAHTEAVRHTPLRRLAS